MLGTLLNGLKKHEAHRAAFETIYILVLPRVWSMRLSGLVRWRLAFISPADDSELAELLWFDANMNARQITLDVSLLEHVPETA